MQKKINLSEEENNFMQMKIRAKMYKLATNFLRVKHGLSTSLILFSKVKGHQFV
jgi:hypothetical protein